MYVRTLCMTTAASIGLCGQAAHLHADITGVALTGYQVSATDYDGSTVDVWVVDMYLRATTENDTVLNVYDLRGTNGPDDAGEMINSLGNVSYYQSQTGAGWLPNNVGAPFETDALKNADSFVSIGARHADGSTALNGGGGVWQMEPNGSALDPAFGGLNATAPGTNAGWYNSNPPSLIGRSMLLDPIGGSYGVFIGRFAVEGTQAFTLTGYLSVTWNDGIGTEPNQGQFYIPAPGAGALLGAAVFCQRRRRRVS